VSTLTGRERFVRALRCEEVDRPPVWLMRQAGRTLPEYRKIRANKTFLQVMKSPELATEVTLQPLRRFGQDVAVVFSDILIVPEAMGLDLSFVAGKGPVIAPTLESDVVLTSMDPARDVPWLGETLNRLRANLGESAGIVGFAGAPFTLLSYMCERIGKEAATGAKRLMLRDPERGHAALAALADAVSELLLYQLEHDIDAVQLFDSWAGSLTRKQHMDWVMPYNTRIVRRVREAGHRILLYGKGTHHLTDDLITVGASGLSVDWRTDLPALARRLDNGGPASVVLQGNIDPSVLYGSPRAVRDAVTSLHQDMNGRRGHVFNLGHGLLPSTPIEGIAAFVQAVKDLA
jgi:uroporphyrinogen decarboxylase